MIIQRFWAGSEMPAEYVEFGHQWQDLNPGSPVIEWSETAAMELLEGEPDLQAVVADLYERDGGQLGIELYVQLADIFGYLLVWMFGGVYVNCDIQPLRPLDELLAGHDPSLAWASYENYEDYRIVNAAIGAPEPQNAFWRALLDELPRRYFSNPTAEMVETTGPALLTDMARDMPQLCVFPKETFNPVHWKEIAPGEDASGFDYPPEAFAVHHWGHKKDGRSNRVETGTQRS